MINCKLRSGLRSIIPPLPFLSLSFRSLMPIKGTNLIKRVGGYGGEAETIVNTRQQAEINSAVGPALIAALINRIRGRARQRGHL